MTYYLKKSDWLDPRKILKKTLLSKSDMPEGMSLGMLNMSNRLELQYDVLDRFASGKVIADLGCGTGLLGLRALEAGAEFVYFVEVDEQMHHIISNVLPNKCDPNKIKIMHKDIENLTDEDFDHSVDIAVSEFYGPRLFDEGYVSYVNHLKSLKAFEQTRFFPNKFGIDFYFYENIDFNDSRIWPPQPELIDHFKFMYKEKPFSAGNMSPLTAKGIKDKEPDFSITFDTRTLIFNNTFEFTYNRNTECLLLGRTYHCTGSAVKRTYNYMGWYLGADDHNKTFRIIIDRSNDYNPLKLQLC